MHSGKEMVSAVETSMFMGQTLSHFEQDMQVFDSRLILNRGMRPSMALTAPSRIPEISFFRI